MFNVITAFFSLPLNVKITRRILMGRKSVFQDNYIIKSWLNLSKNLINKRNGKINFAKESTVPEDKKRTQLATIEKRRRKK